MTTYGATVIGALISYVTRDTAYFGARLPLPKTDPPRMLSPEWAVHKCGTERAVGAVPVDPVR